MRSILLRRALWISVIIAASLSHSSLCGQTAATNRGVQDASPPPVFSLQPGPYYALIIGNNSYRHLPKLQTAINDANEIAQVLQERYGFHTKVLLDADRDQILTALVEYRRTLPENSNLLIYYAGHGHHDPDTNKAYWLPIDAERDSNARWIIADDITSDVRAMPSSHVLVISDSCYSGYLTRAGDVAIGPTNPSAYLARALRSRSRNLMSSGGDEPVADAGSPGHSIFAGVLLDSLRQMEEDNFTAAYLVEGFIRPRVGGRSDQLPQYSVILNSGHDGGDFVFSRLPVVKIAAVVNAPAKPIASDVGGAGFPKTTPANISASVTPVVSSPEASETAKGAAKDLVAAVGGPVVPTGAGRVEAAGATLIPTSTQPPLGRKKRVAVLDFDSAGVEGISAAIFGKKSDVDVGKGMADLLAKQLAKAGAYSVAERVYTEKVLSDQHFKSDRGNPNAAARIGKLLGVDAVIVGSVWQFGSANAKPGVNAAACGFSMGWSCSDTKKSKATCVVNALLVNVDTANIIGAVDGKGESSRDSHSPLGGGKWHGWGKGGVDFGNADFQGTILGEAVNAAVTQMSAGIVADAPKLDVRGTVVAGLVAAVDGDRVVLNVGGKAGLKLGDQLTVQRTSTEIKDPSTGQVIRQLASQIGTLRVTDVDDISAVGTPVSGSGFQVGDAVETSHDRKP